MSRELPSDGSCQQMPIEVVDEYFFEAQLNNSRAKIEMARRVCNNCLVRDECLELALDEMPPYGIFAATLPRERQALKFGGGAA